MPQDAFGHADDGSNTSMSVGASSDDGSSTSMSEQVIPHNGELRVDGSSTSMTQDKVHRAVLVIGGGIVKAFSRSLDCSPSDVSKGSDGNPPH